MSSWLVRNRNRAGNQAGEGARVQRRTTAALDPTMGADAAPAAPAAAASAEIPPVELAGWVPSSRGTMFDVAGPLTIGRFAEAGEA